MDKLEQIFKKYPGFKFWSKKKRQILLYFLVYFAIFITILKITKISKQGDAFLLFFIFWIGIGIFFFITNFSRGMANYLHQYNEDLRLYLFADKFYVETAFPLMGTPGLSKFLLRTKYCTLDQVLKNLKYNISVALLCTLFFFIAGMIVIIQSQP